LEEIFKERTMLNLLIAIAIIYGLNFDYSFLWYFIAIVFTFIDFRLKFLQHKNNFDKIDEFNSKVYEYFQILHNHLNDIGEVVTESKSKIIAQIIHSSNRDAMD
jgi:hypothetical protein